MKRILLILLVSLGAVFAKGQTSFTTPNLVTGGNTKITQNKGAGRFDSGLIVAPRFTDTATANLSVVKLYGGMVIRVLDTLWLRNEDATAWNKMGGTTGGGGGGGSQTWQQTLTTGSTLTGNNTIDGGNFDLKFNSTDFYVGNLGGDNNKVVWTDNDGLLYRTTFPILSDSLNPYITGLQNGVISGCTVTWIANYDYEVSPCTYRIAGVVYNIPTSTSITLAAADPTNDRIDVFYVNTSSVASVVTGTPANPAEEPDIDVSTQLKISFAVVEAATTQPTLAIDDIYKENAGPPTEWTYSDNTANLNPASTTNPYAGTFDIEGTNVTSGNQFTMTVGTTPVFTDYVFLNFKIRSKATWAAGRVIAIQFFNGVTPVGSTVVFGQGTYGFQSSITASYQNISIPLGDFGDITGATSVRFIRNGASTIGFYIDNILLLEARSYFLPGIDNIVGTAPISVSTLGNTANVSLNTNGVTNTYIRQSAGLSVIGNSTNATANVADITAGTDHNVLRRSGTSLGFGTLNAAAMNPTYSLWKQLQTDGSGNLSWVSTDTVGIVDVAGYILSGNFGTDTTAAINAAINDAAGTVKKTVRFSTAASPYVVQTHHRTAESSTNKRGIELQSNINIIIDPGVTIYADTAWTATTANAKFYPIFNGYGVSNVKIIGGTGSIIDGQNTTFGNYTTNPYTNPSGYVADTANRFSTSGIQFFYGSNNTVDGVKVQNCQLHGIMAMYTTNLNVFRSILFRNGGSAFTALRNCTVNLDYVIADSNASDQIRVEYCNLGTSRISNTYAANAQANASATNWFAGYYVAYSSNVKVDNCEAYNNSAYGYDNPSDTTYRGNEVTNSLFRYNRNAGIVTACPLQIKNNWFVNNGKDVAGITDTKSGSGYNPAAIAINSVGGLIIEGNHSIDTVSGGNWAQTYFIKQTTNASFGYYRSSIVNNYIKGVADTAFMRNGNLGSNNFLNNLQFTNANVLVNPATTGFVWTLNADGAGRWAAGSSSTALSALTAASASNSISNANNTQTWDWNTLGAATGMIFRSTSTQAQSALNKVVSIQSSGVSVNGGQTTYGLEISNTKTGPGTPTNIALYATASGATFNYAAVFDGGNVGIGTTTPAQLLDIRGATNAYTRLDQIATSGQAAHLFYANGTLKWQFGMDFASNGNKDFYVYDQANAKGRIAVSATGVTYLGGSTYSGTSLSSTLSGLNILATGEVGFGITATTAQKVLLPAGTTSVSPLKFTSGTNLTTATAGSMEYDGTNLFFTPSTVRHTIYAGLAGSATLDFGNTAAQSSADLTITVTGAADGDPVELGVPNASTLTNSCFTAWVSAANTVTVRYNNYSSGAQDPASGTFKVFVKKN